MTIKTVLTSDQIMELFEWYVDDPEYTNTSMVFARAIEQAALQSLEIQALRKDAKRLDWLESCEESHGFYHAGYGDYLYYAHQEEGYPSVREIIDTAMEERND